VNTNTCNDAQYATKHTDAECKHRKEQKLRRIYTYIHTYTITHNTHPHTHTNTHKQPRQLRATSIPAQRPATRRRQTFPWPVQLYASCNTQHNTQHNTPTHTHKDQRTPEHSQHCTKQHITHQQHMTHPHTQQHITHARTNNTSQNIQAQVFATATHAA